MVSLLYTALPGKPKNEGETSAEIDALGATVNVHSMHTQVYCNNGSKSWIKQCKS